MKALKELVRIFDMPCFESCLSSQVAIKRCKPVVAAIACHLPQVVCPSLPRNNPAYLETNSELVRARDSVVPFDHGGT